MRPPNERYPGLSDDADGTIDIRLADDLTKVYRAVAPPLHLDSRVLTVVRAATSERSRPRTRALWMPQLRLRFAAIGAALLLLLGAVAGYLRPGSPAQVSAQTVLRRAAALHLGPNQAAHMVDNVSMTIQGATAHGTADLWIQTDARGTPALSAQTLSIGKPGVDNGTAPALGSRFIQIGRQILAYNPEMRGDNTILLSVAGQTRAYPSWVVPNDVFDGGGVAQSLSTLAQESPQRVQLLAQQTLDGVAVDVIQVNGWAERPAQRTTFYFDAQSYVLRGFDAVSMDPSYPTPAWQVRLSSYDAMPATAVPPHTFTLNAPPTATVHPLDLGGPDFSTFAAAVAATCHSSVNVKLLLRSGQSLLAACQATAPNVTAADLAAALAAPDKEALDAAAAAGVLTPTEAARYLSGAQAQLVTWVTSVPSVDTSSGTAPK